MKKMQVELFDRYVHQVGRRLPRKLRADVEAELHSLLMDTLQGRTVEGEAKNEAAIEADQIAILEEFGPPAKVAAQYQPPRRYVIGPRVFDIYLIVVAAVAGSITLACLVLLALTLWGETEPLSALASSFGDMFGVYLDWLLLSFGSVTLTFAILERVLPEATFDIEDEEDWDPRTLPEIEDPTRVEVSGCVIETSVLVIALIAFNFFPQWVGIGFVGSIDGSPTRWHLIPIMSPTFFTAYLPLLNVLWILSIGLNVVLLRQGQWQRLTRLADCVLTACGAFILYRMVTGPPILTMQAVTPESLRQILDSIFPTLLKVALVIGLVSSIGEAIHKLYLVFRDHSRAVPDLSNQAADL
jgi:hypothetical protein